MLLRVISDACWKVARRVELKLLLAGNRLPDANCVVGANCCELLRHTWPNGHCQHWSNMRPQHSAVAVQGHIKHTHSARRCSHHPTYPVLASSDACYNARKSDV